MRERAVTAFRAALEAAGVAFTNGDEPGVTLKRRSGDDQDARSRARSRGLRPGGIPSRQPSPIPGFEWPEGRGTGILLSASFFLRSGPINLLVLTGRPIMLPG